MASFVFSNAKLQLSYGNLSFEPGEGVYKLALMSSDIRSISGVVDFITWGQIKTHEVDDNDTTKYTPKMLSGVTSERKNNGECIISADNVSYPISTISASYIVIVKSSTNNGIINDDDILVLAIDVRNGGNPITSNNGVFNINLNSASGGFLKIK